MPMGFGYGYGGLPFGAVDTTPIMRAKFASDDAQYREGQKHQDEQNHTAIKLLAGAALFAGVIWAIRHGGGKKVSQKMKKLLIDNARTQAEQNIAKATNGLKPGEIVRAMEKANISKPSDYQALLNSGTFKGILAGKPTEEQRVLVSILKEKMGASADMTEVQKLICQALKEGVSDDFVSKLTTVKGKVSESAARSIETFIKAARTDGKTVDTIFNNVPKLTEDQIISAYRKIWAREATKADVKAALKMMSEGWYRRPGKYGKKIGDDTTKGVEDAVKKAKGVTPPPVDEAAKAAEAAADAEKAAKAAEEARAAEEAAKAKAAAEEAAKAAEAVDMDSIVNNLRKSTNIAEDVKKIENNQLSIVTNKLGIKIERPRDFKGSISDYNEYVRKCISSYLQLGKLPQEELMKKAEESGINIMEIGRKVLDSDGFVDEPRLNHILKEMLMTK